MQNFLFYCNCLYSESYFSELIAKKKIKLAIRFMLNKFTILYYTLLLIPIQISGQDPSFINYDTKDGLPSSEVYDVAIYESGLLWFSTDRGVCSYDGYNFDTYTTSNGLADNTNFKIFKDPKNDYGIQAIVAG